MLRLAVDCYPTIFRSRFEYGLLLKDIKFSTCGKYLVVADCDSRFPEILSLEQHREYRQAKDHETQEGNGKKTQSFEQTMLSTNSAGRPRTERVLTTISRDAALVSTAVLKLDGNQLTTSVLAKDEGEDEVSLLDLPNWSGLEDSRLFVALSKNEDDKVDNVFKAIAQPWYDYPMERGQRLEGGRNQGKRALPILVSKDTRAIRIPTSSSVSQIIPGTVVQRLLDNEESSGSLYLSPNCTTLIIRSIITFALTNFEHLYTLFFLKNNTKLAGDHGASSSLDLRV